MIRSYRGRWPQIAPSAYVDPAAVVIGDVTIGEHSSVWPAAVIRGDVHWIRIGARSNVQDGSVLHVMKDQSPLSLGDEVTVGHGVVLHGCTIESRVLVGMGSILLNDARIGTGSIIAAGTLVPERTVVPPNSLVMGHPGKVIRALGPKDLENIEAYARRYVGYAQDYINEAKAAADAADVPAGNAAPTIVKTDAKTQVTKFQAIKGVRDILPPDSALWNRVEQTARDVFATYGYGEIRLPIFEQTELFARAVGTETDVVSKEMYTFEDYETSELVDFRNAVITWQESPITPELAARFGHGARATFAPFVDLFGRFSVLAASAAKSGQLPRTPENERLCSAYPGEREIFAVSIDSRSIRENRQAVDSLKEIARRLKFGDSLTLRPEATASVVRAYIEHGMQTRPGNVKLYYIGPMFRRERPQKGRYRQFYQIGAELLGQSDAPAIDAELIEMLLAFFARVNLQNASLAINSIGDRNCRPAYIARLREALEKVREKLGPDSQRRIETNPLRVLDSKLPEEQAVIETLPRIADCLCAECKEHYAELKRQLALRDIIYKEDWRLVRGLDYYMRTTFEITAPGLGSQNAVCGGGRYDGLVEMLGGPPTKGIGFAIGTDRLMLSLGEAGAMAPAAGLDVFIAWLGAGTYPAAVALAKTLRQRGIAVELPATEMKFGKSLSLADRLGARYAVILGEDELATQEFTLKRLSDGQQQKLPEAALGDYIRNTKRGEKLG